MAIRGTWLLEDAIRRRWVDEQLDDAFRQTWPDKTRQDVVPYNLDEARAADPHPRPYCVVEIGTPVSKGNSTGLTADTEITYQDVPVTFKIHATQKADARDYAILVAGAYVKKKLTIAQDRHIETLIDPDFHVRDGDKSWTWVLQFRFRIEGDYPREYT